MATNTIIPTDVQLWMRYEQDTAGQGVDYDDMDAFENWVEENYPDAII